MRSHLEVVDDARLNCFAASHQCPLHAVVREVDEEVFVVYRNLASLQVDRSRPDVLVDVAHLVHVRVRHAVGANQTVVVEVAVGTVVRVIVAAVFVDFNAVLAFSAEALVDKVPNEAALILRIFANEVPIFFETALRVAHCVSIFALNERESLGVVLAVVFARIIVVVHRAENVGVRVHFGALILSGAAWVLSLHPIVASLEVVAKTGFVAQRPEDD